MQNPALCDGGGRWGTASCFCSHTKEILEKVGSHLQHREATLPSPIRKGSHSKGLSKSWNLQVRLRYSFSRLGAKGKDSGKRSILDPKDCLSTVVFLS